MVQCLIPQQRKLIGSSAQNSSGVHWCRRRVRLEKVWVQSQVRFNSVPEKVPQKVPEKVWETLVQSHIRFNRVPEKVLGEALVQSQVGINRVLEKVPKKVWETLVQIQVQEGSGEGTGRLWCRAGLLRQSTATQRTLFSADGMFSR